MWQRRTYLLISLLLGVGGAAWARGNGQQLQAIEVSASSAGSTAIRVRCEQAPAFAVFNLEEPARLVVDISNAKIGQAPSWQDVGSWAVSHVSASSLKKGSWSGVRITVGLRRKVASQVKLHGTDLMISLQSLVPPPAASALASRPGAGEQQRRSAAQAAAMKAEVKRLLSEMERARARQDARWKEKLAARRAAQAAELEQ